MVYPLGPLPPSVWRLRHLIFCTDVFTKTVKLYPVTRPTKKEVLNAILKCRAVIKWDLQQKQMSQTNIVETTSGSSVAGEICTWSGLYMPLPLHLKTNVAKTRLQTFRIPSKGTVVSSLHGELGTVTVWDFLRIRGG